MKVEIYRNKKNPNKYIEVHRDGHGHAGVRQFIAWRKTMRAGGTGYIINTGVTLNYTGDGFLHRWRAPMLAELLEDYEPMRGGFRVCGF